MAKQSNCEPGNWIDRTYFKIQPTESQLHPQTIVSTFKQLHQLESSDSEQPWYKRIFPPSTTPSTIEWLLVSNGTSGGRCEYYIGVNKTELVSRLRNICRGLYPNDFSFEKTDWHPAQTLVPDKKVTQEDPAGDTESLSIEDNSYAGVTFRARVDRRRDWQTPLQSFETFTPDSVRLPLATVLETLAASSVPMIYQVLLRPHPDWTDAARLREMDLRMGHDTPAQRLGDWVSPTDEDRHDRSLDDLGEAHANRIEQITNRNTRRSFTVTVRAVAGPYTTETGSTGPDDSELFDLATGLEALSNEYHEIVPEIHRGDSAKEVVRQLCDRRPAAKQYDRLYTKLPFTANTSHGILADASEAPGFCLLDGTALTAAGDRALATTPGERTPIQQPPTEVLNTYRGEGFALGRPLDQDNTSSDRIVLPPSLQPLHIAWLGKTGAGKSTNLVNGMVSNHAATDGADILIDPKDDGMSSSYLRAHYAEHGDLKDVYYFDCRETVPALSFFDIRAQLADGISRTTAVEDVIDHYVEMLIGIMGRKQFNQAVRSPDIIRYLLKALFDPVHGDDAFSHHELQRAVTQLRNSQDPPPVSDDDLQEMLYGVATNNTRSFEEIMQGVANRIEKIPLHARLGRIFNHVPEQGDPQFDLRSILDEDAVVILNVGGIENESQRVLTLILLSKLWTALRRRARQRDSDADLPLVNLYLEEAAKLGQSELLGDLLSQSRSFGLSLTLAMQFPQQLEDSHVDVGVYTELLNNVSTIITGNVGVDELLAKRLTTDEMSPADMGNRIRSLPRGRWLAKLPAEYGEVEPRPFQLESLPQPPGHPDGPQPLSDEQTVAFEAGVDVVQTKTRRNNGLEVRSAGTRSATDPAADESTIQAHLDSALPYTERLPETVEYDAHEHRLTCAECESRNEPTPSGMRDAINCCGQLSQVDRDSIPICDLPLNMSENEQRRSPYTHAQLRFMKAVNKAHRQQFDTEFEYDIVRDSMRRLQEYTGIDDEAVQELIDAGMLRVDCTHPHKLYTVSAEGRKEINERHRQGVTFGDGKGDLSESSLHVMMVELGRRYIEQEYVNDIESPVTDTVVYHEVTDSGRRLDAAGIDDDGTIIVTLEAERSNHDTRIAVPEDYETMAACHPVEAIWVVKNRDGAHDVLNALQNPKSADESAPDPDPYITRTFSSNSPPRRLDIDKPGCTDIWTLKSLQKFVLDSE